MKPGGRIVLVMTRWHVDDLAGRLIGQGGWEILRLPALAEADDPMGRAPGEALWPAWEDRAALLEKQALLGERQFSCLFQQAPRELTGRVFDVRRLAVVDDVPSGVAVRAWDLAATDEQSGGNPDWSVGLKLVRTEAGAFCIDDVIRFRRGPAGVAAEIRAAAERDGAEVAIGLPQDPGQAGRAQVMYLAQSLVGYRVNATPETGAKEVRARPVATHLERGLLSMRRAGWNASLLDEIAQFPHGPKDDQVDALSRAFGMFLELTPPARFARLAFSER
jgi:predicted phage terminase large subunit-like protein